ncbi:MAG: AmmeMemoRadiSam system protein B [archaeon]
MTRKAAFAGIFYEAQEQALTKQITDCFTDNRGPGDLPLKRGKKEIHAIIAPAASYSFAGPCAAWAYKEIAEATFSDVYIIIGPQHANKTNAVSLVGYETPLGMVRVDQTLANALLGKNKDLVVDEQVHAEEHCIELQIPFLQFATQDKMHELKILPILLSTNVNAKQLALDLKEVLVEQNKKATFIVCSDFTHYGRKYHYVPFSQDIKKNIYDMDRDAIAFIKKQDVKGFFSLIKEKFLTIDGYVPIIVLLLALKKVSARLEQYYTSADVTNDERYLESVSYAAIIFE